MSEFDAASQDVFSVEPFGSYDSDNGNLPADLQPESEPDTDALAIASITTVKVRL